MDRFGFIHEKLDIKILILFVLNRLPADISREDLAALVMCDDGISYFDFIECLDELERTGHLRCEEERYAITEKGAADGSAIESSIPYSVRSRAERAALTTAAGMRRDTMIKTAHESLPDGECSVELSLADGVGEIIYMRLLAANERQAEDMKSCFRANAESVYAGIVSLLRGDAG